MSKWFKAIKGNEIENSYEMYVYDDCIEISRYGDSGCFFFCTNRYDLTDIHQIEELEKVYNRQALDEISNVVRDTTDLEAVRLAVEMWYNGLIVFEELKAGYVEFEEE